jgi:hypothetical protein
MRTALTAALLLSLAVAAPSAKADVFLADFQGYDFTWPLPSCLDCPGQYYEAQGFIGSVNPTYLNFNYGANQYTFVLGDNLFFADADTFGTTVVSYYTNGSIDFIEDSIGGGSAATYNYNGDCDPFEDRLTFQDGTVALHGVFSSFFIVNDTSTGNGNLEGVTNWTSGSQIGNIPVSQRNGWTFGAIGLRLGSTPCGYHWQIDGECYLPSPVPTKNTTWGAIKSLEIESSIGIRR